jgi:toxin ParE1/3/4
MKVSLSRQALQDALAAADWYTREFGVEAALKLQERIQQALNLLAHNPGLGTPGPADTCVFPVRRFPVSLVYRVAGDALRVIAVASHKRRPRFWAGRE